MRATGSSPRRQLSRRRWTLIKVTVWYRLGILVACGSLSKVIRSLTAVFVPVLLDAEHGQALGLHRDLEDRDLSGVGRSAIGNEVEGIAMERVVRVFRGGREQESTE